MSPAPALPELSPPVVLALVEGVRGVGYREGVLALRGRPVWSGPPRLPLDDGGEVQVVPCVSALAAWEAVLARDADWLVVITDRDQADLGDGLCAHFVEQRVIVPRLWQAVRQRFQARQIAPALAREPKQVAQALLAQSPPGGWPPARAGVLSRDEALGALAKRTLGLAPDRVDPQGLLEWTLDPANLQGPDRLDPAVREALFRWLDERVGVAGRCTLAVVEAGHGRDALALALVAGLLADPHPDRVRAAEVRGRLAHRYGGVTPTGEAARAWSEAARGVLERRLREPEVSVHLERAEEILASVQALDLAERSSVLPRGFEARLRGLAGAVREALRDDRGAGPEAVERAYLELSKHLLAERWSRRVARAHMALRLVRWLALPDVTAPRTVAEAVDRQVREDGWVDRARAGVWDGDTDPWVAAAYRELYEAVSERRLGHDRRFGELLAAELAAGREPGSLLCVEDLLPAVVVPLARRRPVLLVVVDGMSTAVAAELGEDLERHGWPEVLPQGSRHRRGALAAFPSTTEVCRTSLLSGRLRRGGQEEERSGLEELAQRHRLRAVLFHQADLERSAAGEALAGPVREAIADPRLRIVAVVLNAVDDALDRGDPGRSWGVESITHLEALLQAARFASRVVVLVSDHGHVVERRDGELRAQPGAVAARWRPPSEPAGPGEVRLRGRRVLAPEGMVAPWREDLRYARLRAGYHGGASPAEAVVPLLVYSSVELDRWEAAPPQAPAWWLGAPVQAPAASTPDEPGQISLFEASPGGAADLASAVLASPIYAAQREKARRTALEDATVAAILRALLGAGGRLGQDALAAVIGVPRYRLGGVIRAAQRHLNVDGYDVIGYDADGTTVVLDETLLREQFDLSA